MNLPPLTPPSFPSHDPADEPSVQPAVPQVPPIPPLPVPDASAPELPVDQQSDLTPPEFTPSPSAFAAPAETPALPAQESPTQDSFVPSSPILAGLQGMSSQPFQDPSTIVAGQASLSTPSGAIPSNSAVPQETVSSGLNRSPVPLRSEPAPAPETTSAPASNTPPVAGAVSGATADKTVRKSRFSLPALPRGKGLIALIAVVGIGVLGLLAAAFFLTRSATSNQADVTPATKTMITYWGLWESNEVMEPLLQQYESLNPGIDIVYQQQNSKQYRARTQTALKGGSGPDIFRFHNTWLPMIEDDLATAPRSVLPATELQQAFYPIMAEELVQNNQVVGVPLMFEGMALLYNESMLEAGASLPPKDWREVRELAARLTIKATNETSLDRGGIALGTADNVDNFSDILALMMLQNSATPGNPLSENAQTALQFYTLFSRGDGVWDANMSQSTVSFANEKVAMILVPSWRIHEIRRLNPNLRFGVARLPQLSDERITWASYWVEGVNKNSKNAEESWKFLAWLSQPEQLRRLHSEATKYRGFGELYPRVEMASELADDPLLQPYLEDALYAKSWPLASMTHDEGLNDQLIQYYTDAVNQMNRTGNAQSALENVIPGIQQVLSRYGISVARN